VDAQLVGEGFLAQAASLPVGAQVPPYPLLKLALWHPCNLTGVLLVGLQTDK